MFVIRLGIPALTIVWLIPSTGEENLCAFAISDLLCAETTECICSPPDCGEWIKGEYVHNDLIDGPHEYEVVQDKRELCKTRYTCVFDHTAGCDGSEDCAEVPMPEYEVSHTKQWSYKFKVPAVQCF